jgi:hypothetical protein
MSFRAKKFQAFGWVLQRTTIDGPENYTVNYTETHSLHEEATLPLYTKGVIRMDLSKSAIVNPHIQSLIPGTCTLLQPEFASYVLQAGDSIRFDVEDHAEFWTCCASLNNNQMPKAEIFRLKSGESVNISGKKLFLCEGVLIANGILVQCPSELDVSGSVNVTANGDCYGIFFDYERP